MNLTDSILNKVPKHFITFQDDSFKDIVLVTSEKYEGQVSKGLRHGQGILKFPNGEYYKGAFRSDERSGNGVCYFNKTGVIYKGEWREDMMNGHGILFCPPGEIIEANFVDSTISDGKVKILVSGITN